MTDAPPSTDAATPVKPAELAAYLAARLCHDFISPASAIVSGLDLLEDPTAQDMREEAMGLVASSARKLADLLSFSRVAFGASAGAQTFDARDLETLAQGVFAHMRAELVWDSSVPAINKPAARTLLNLAQMAGAALPTGGTATVRLTQSQDTLDIAVEALGPRARLRPNGQRLALLGFTRLASACVCLPLTWIASTQYPLYASAARAYGLSAINDQHLAGASMCFIEALVFSIAFAAVFISILGRDDSRQAGQFGGGLREFGPGQLRHADEERLARADDLGDRPRRDQASLVHDDKMRAAAFHLGQQMAGDDHRPAGDGGG